MNHITAHADTELSSSSFFVVVVVVRDGHAEEKRVKQIIEMIEQDYTQLSSFNATAAQVHTHTYRQRKIFLKASDCIYMDAVCLHHLL